MWGINEKYKHAWLEYGRTARSLQEVFFLVAVLYLTIERYVKKMRETKKIKKEVEDVRLQRRNKLLNVRVKSRRRPKAKERKWTLLSGMRTVGSVTSGETFSAVTCVPRFSICSVSDSQPCPKASSSAKPAKKSDKRAAKLRRYSRADSRCASISGPRSAVAVALPVAEPSARTCIG